MMIGAALGALLSYGLPNMGPGFWAMIGIGATMSAALRVPMTAIVFTVEETHDWNMLLPLLIGCVASYAVSTLLLKRSILTEKVARRRVPSERGVFHRSSGIAVRARGDEYCIRGTSERDEPERQ